MVYWNKWRFIWNDLFWRYLLQAELVSVAALCILAEILITNPPSSKLYASDCKLSSLPDWLTDSNQWLMLPCRIITQATLKRDSVICETKTWSTAHYLALQMSMEINEEHKVNKAKSCLHVERISIAWLEVRRIFHLTWGNKDGLSADSIHLK